MTRRDHRTGALSRATHRATAPSTSAPHLNPLRPPERAHQRPLGRASRCKQRDRAWRRAHARSATSWNGHADRPTSPARIAINSAQASSSRLSWRRSGTEHLTRHDELLAPGLPLAVVVDKPTAARALKLDNPETVGVAFHRGCRFMKAAVHIRPAVGGSLQASTAQVREPRPRDRRPRPSHHRSRVWRDVRQQLPAVVCVDRLKPPESRAQRRRARGPSRLCREAARDCSQERCGKHDQGEKLPAHAEESLRESGAGARSWS